MNKYLIALIWLSAIVAGSWLAVMAIRTHTAPVVAHNSVQRPAAPVIAVAPAAPAHVTKAVVKKPVVAKRVKRNLPSRNKLRIHRVPEGRTIRMEATAYCLRGRTASGKYVGPGVIAVDPRIIPLGSRVYVEHYGYATCLDTGGDIKGARIDVWFASRTRCFEWGRRTVHVTIVSTP